MALGGLSAQAFHSVFLIDGDLAGQRQARVESQMGDGDEGLLFHVTAEIQLAEDTALIAHVIQQGDYSGRWDG